MSEFVVHLLLSAYFATLIGCFLLFLLAPLLPLSRAASPAPLAFTLFAAFIAPLLTWFISIPLACCSFIFFRFTAASRARGLFFWFVAWCLIGTLSGGIIAVAMGLSERLRSFAIIGFLVGAIVAPAHRRLWFQLYNLDFPNSRDFTLKVPVQRRSKPPL